MHYLYFGRNVWPVVRLWLLVPSLSVMLSPFASAPDVRGATIPSEEDTVRIDRVAIEGTIHTRDTTLIQLLPRPVPDHFTRAEVTEFERRVRNLSLFDEVHVTREGSLLRVAVQEKLTLAPILTFTSGSTAKDLNATVGLVEYNMWGAGTQLGGQFSYSQRGPNVDLWLSQHPFEPDRWAKEVKGFYHVNGIRFADSPFSWTRNRFGAELEVRGPYNYGSPFRYEVVLEVYREVVLEEHASRPLPNGYYVGLIPEFTWDRYQWHDLVPSGYRISLDLKPGFFFGANHQRHEAKLRYLQGVPLGSKTVLMVNSVAEAVNNTGNPNHSLLLGSIVGIRGLSDNLYRNRAQTYTNLEFRHAVSLAPRWALQGVLFSDVGAFQSFDEDGALRPWKGAVSVGGGFRLIPTFLSNTLLRVDVAQLLAPNQNTLVQVGITQYF
ncbi:MAG: hypothetical protein KF722_14760 [Nitrospira sp.]|nr:hypothetical protein [Nitrospira sp.]